MASPPQMPAPSVGEIPDRGPELMALLWVFTTLSLGVVVMRFATRLSRSTLGWDDWFMLFAMMCFFGWTITLTLLCLNGGERHIQDVAVLGIDTVAKVQLLNWTSQVFGILGVAAGKVSVSALLLTIMSRTRRNWQKVYIWVFCIVVLVCSAIACCIVTFAQCRPAAALWDPRIKGECIDPHIMANYGTFMGSYNTFVDASLALLPTTIFWSLQISREDKVKLSIVFALNILTSISSGIKTSFLSQLANRVDLTWATFDIFAWVTVEFFLVIVCGTVPTLKPVWEMTATRWTRLVSRTYGDSSSKNTNASDGTANFGQPMEIDNKAFSYPSGGNSGRERMGGNQIQVQTSMDVDYYKMRGSSPHASQ